MSNLLTQLAKTLDELRIPYMVVGGQAVLVYGEPRLTRDIDLILGITPDEYDRVLEVAERLELRILVENPGEFARRTWVLPALHEETGLRVDFMFSWTPYERQALGRVRQVSVAGYSVRYASPEDVVIHKLLAGRPRDLEDVRGILRKHSLDVRYIRGWLRQFEKTLGKPLLAAFEQIFHEESSQ